MADDAKPRKLDPDWISAVRRDFEHYCKIQGARTLGQKLRVPLQSPSLLALAVHRFGKWIRAPERPPPLRECGGIAHRILYELVQRTTRVHIVPDSEIGEEVWLSPNAPHFIGGKVGRGCSLLGGNTLGRSGPDQGRPTLGENVTVGPGTIILGAVTIPGGTTLGANCVVSRTLPAGGVYVGTPLRPARPAEPAPEPERAAMNPGLDEPFLRDLRADVARHFAFDPELGLRAKLKIALTTDGIWAAGVYRLGRALRGRRRGPAGRLAWAGFRSLELLVRRVSGIHLDVESRIGPGFYVGHFASIYVGPGVRIGEQCSIGQTCFVGSGGQEAIPGAPILGDRVYLGVGAKVLGGVRVGDGVAVGANAVVLQDVPANAVVAGNPARVVSFRGSEDFLGLKPVAATDASKAGSPAARNVVANRVQGTPPSFTQAAEPSPYSDSEPSAEEPARDTER